MTKISRKKFCEILRRAILQNPCGETFVAESAFNKIAGKDYGPTT